MKAENLSERGQILLSAYSALVGAVLPNLRSVSIDWDDTIIRLYFVFDESYSEDDQEEMECVATEILADFPERDIQSEFTSVPISKPRPSLGKLCIFARKEG